MKKLNISYALEALSCATLIVLDGGNWEELLAATFMMIIAALIQSLMGGKG